MLHPRSVLLAGLAIAIAPPVRAAEVAVPADDPAALVRLVASANDGDVLVLPGSSTYRFDSTYDPAAAPAVVNALPPITKSLTIRSDGTGPATLQRAAGAPAFRLIEVGEGGSLTLQGLRLTGGNPGTGRPGGCILVSATTELGTLDAPVPSLVLQGVQVDGCVAARGGGIASDTEPIDDGIPGEETFDYPGGKTVIADSTITGNRAGIGGGIATRGGSLVVQRSHVDGNTAAGNGTRPNNVPGGVGGGGLATVGEPSGDSAYEVLIEDSTFTGNRVVVSSGIDDDVVDPAPIVDAFGGGIANELAVDRLTIRRSTIAGNTVQGGGQVVGGGIAGAASELGGGSEIVLENVTIADNVAEAFGEFFGSLGGGIGDRDDNSWYLAAVTVVRNAARLGAGADPLPPGARGGGLGLVGGTLEMLLGIVAANTSAGTGPNCAPAASDELRTAESQGYNFLGLDCADVIEPDVNRTDDTTGDDVQVDVLRDNGGFTPTVALLAGSPAIDRVPLEACRTYDEDVFLDLPLAEDQRGTPRPQDGACDIGAFEVPAAATTTTTTTTTTTLVATTTSTIAATTTTQPGGTTTTTLPACPSGASFASVTCRLDDLAADVDAAGDLDKVRSKVVAGVTAGRQKAAQAAAVVGSKPPKASRTLRAAAKKLSGVARALGSKAARAVPDDTRTRLLRQISPLVVDLKALAKAPA